MIEAVAHRAQAAIELLSSSRWDPRPGAADRAGRGSGPQAP
jgi:hypothetical protein